jgi:hypothetical protein
MTFMNNTHAHCNNFHTFLIYTLIHHVSIPRHAHPMKNSHVRLPAIV